jgi:hypothetical protein
MYVVLADCRVEPPRANAREDEEFVMPGGGGVGYVLDGGAEH